MKGTCITLLLFATVLMNAQDTIRLKHTNYTAVYSKSLNYPVLVEWWETKAKDGCPVPLKRKDEFKADPLLPRETDLMKDYVGSGYDRGHMCPAASNLCSGDKVQSECFYFSNMTPQPHTLNAGSWKTLETQTRALAIEKDSVHVWCGSVGKLKTFGTHNVAIPLKCWKVIYIKKTKEFRAYIFPNTSEKITLEKLLVRKEDIEKLTGYKFR